MESLGTVSEGEWSSLSGVYTTEEVDFVAQLLDNCLHHPDPEAGYSILGTQFTHWTTHGAGHINLSSASVHERSFCTSDFTNNSSLQFFSPSSSYNSGSSSAIFTFLGHENYDLNDSNTLLTPRTEPMDCGTLSIGKTNSFNKEMSESEGNVEESGEGVQTDYFLKSGVSPNGESKACARVAGEEENNRNSVGSTKKRTQSSSNARRTKRNVKPKKNQDLDFPSQDEGDGIAVANNNQSSSICTSEEESSVSRELNPSAGATSSSRDLAGVKLSTKTRASRGSATDPQSLYARKRRERINERLRILQNLIPNGTKVDISTMLEEAVHYVKFLQLQIKLLSSDDLWMYAPIAHNGMDIGLLDLKVNIPR